MIHNRIINNWPSGLPPQVLKVPHSPYQSPSRITLAVLRGPAGSYRMPPLPAAN